MRRALIVPSVALLLVVAAGCGKKEVIPSGAEKAVTNVVSSKTPFTPTDVSCPSGEEAKVGNTFDCSFTGPKGVPYTAHMRITKVDGDKVLFFINTSVAK